MVRNLHVPSLAKYQCLAELSVYQLWIAYHDAVVPSTREIPDKPSGTIFFNFIEEPHSDDILNSNACISYPRQTQRHEENCGAY